MTPKCLNNAFNRITQRSRRSRELTADEKDEISSQSDMHEVRMLCKLPSILLDITPSNLNRLNQEVQDYLIVHGGLLKAISGFGHQSSSQCRTVGVSLHPSPFPRTLFEEACHLQLLFQKLYMNVSLDPAWMEESLRDLIKSDSLTRILWSIFEAAKDRLTASNNRISAGILRSDYMIHAESEHNLQLKQVELNTISCAGAAHGQRVIDMHTYLHRTGLYQDLDRRTGHERHAEVPLEIPKSGNVSGICSVLCAAHTTYLQSRRTHSSEEQCQTCILMVVQPNNCNIADERPIEFALNAMDPPIPCFRVEWGRDMLDFTKIMPSGTLLFQPPHLKQAYIVSVAYFRAGFEPHEFIHDNETIGFDARVRFEMSDAVMCPDILTHLAGSKKVQQALCVSGAVERYLPSNEAQRVRQSFMNMYPLDESLIGTAGRAIAIKPASARQHVLKPSRDGGGHNVYREAIVPFLQQLPKSRWAEFVLMEMIEPVVGRNALVSSRGVWLGDVIAELGVWGGCIWVHGERHVEMVTNEQFGWSVRSKVPNVDEMSVVKGYGCFDSICLIDEAVAKT